MSWGRGRGGTPVVEMGGVDGAKSNPTEESALQQLSTFKAQCRTRPAALCLIPTTLAPIQTEQMARACSWSSAVDTGELIVPGLLGYSRSYMRPLVRTRR